MIYKIVSFLSLLHTEFFKNHLSLKHHNFGHNSLNKTNYSQFVENNIINHMYEKREVLYKGKNRMNTRVNPSINPSPQYTYKLIIFLKVMNKFITNFKEM